MLSRWRDHVRRRPVLGVLEITVLWHVVLIGVAEGLPPIAPDWFPDLGATLVNLVCASVILVLLYAWRLNGEVTGRGRRWYLALPLDDTLFQVLSATVFGFCLAGARLHMHTVWPLVFVHGLDDWLQINSPGKAPDWWQVTTMLVYVAYGFWLVRTSRFSGTPVHRA